MVNVLLLFRIYLLKTLGGEGFLAPQKNESQREDMNQASQFTSTRGLVAVSVKDNARVVVRSSRRRAEKVQALPGPNKSKRPVVRLKIARTSGMSRDSNEEVTESPVSIEQSSAPSVLAPPSASPWAFGPVLRGLTGRKAPEYPMENAPALNPTTQYFYPQSPVATYPGPDAVAWTTPPGLPTDLPPYLGAVASTTAPIIAAQRFRSAGTPTYFMPTSTYVFLGRTNDLVKLLIIFAVLMFCSFAMGFLLNPIMCPHQRQSSSQPQSRTSSPRSQEEKIVRPSLRQMVNQVPQVLHRPTWSQEPDAADEATQSPPMTMASSKLWRSRLSPQMKNTPCGTSSDPIGDMRLKPPTPRELLRPPPIST